MALTKNVNAYSSVVEADSYFENRLDAAAWTDADATEKSKALITATSLLETMSWTGEVVSESQPLAFPRSGDYFDPRLGTTAKLTAEVPKRIIEAQYELAYHLLNNDGLLDSTGSVTALKIGTIDLSEIRNPPKIPSHVSRLIRPLLISGGSSSWWRAN